MAAGEVLNDLAAGVKRSATDTIYDASSALAYEDTHLV